MSVNRIINPPGLPEPVGFSHAVAAEGSRVLYVSGQTGHRADGSIDDDLLVQFRQALAAVARCMEEAGFPPESLARMVIYTTDVAAYRNSLGPIGSAYREVFGRHFPAMALFGVTELFDPAARIELVATAVTD
ncbi:MAG TPA: RidA family protein [Acidimicrobiia bacterium]|nr:RidA family protein [Acidimicrobiia bacterium]